MKKLLERIGIMAFWATLPALIIYLSRRPRTRVLLHCGDKLVVVKGWLGSGKWVLPGGGLHKGEEPAAGLLREVREETGIQLERAQVRPLVTEEYRHQGIHFLCHYFVAELPEELPLRAQPMEISDLAWMKRGMLNSTNSQPDVLIALNHLDHKSV